ncbi:hypothetical protein ACFQ08_04715 [Streptosporangium algeriense]|uniref:Apea-like HEPN domain-containing protein n=1 Tax=Streptosporangium algeriense TaxID=1682748 RepID=A0ABW3DKY5_9ACTN
MRMLRVLQIIGYPQVRCQAVARLSAMSSVTAIYHFEVESLWIHADLMGTRQTARVGGYLCTLVFPLDHLDFDVREEDRIQIVRGWSEDPSGEKIKWSVCWVRVEVEIPSDLTAANFPDGGSNEHFDEAQELLRTAHLSASEFVTRIMRQISVTYKQFWLGPSVKRFTPGWRSGYLLDRNGSRIPVGYGIARGGVLRLNVSVPDANDFVTLIQNVTDDAVAEPPLAETLLGDAIYASSDARHPDLRLGTLLAAVACEVKVKAAMRRLASPEQSALVDLVIASPRDVSLAAAFLFDRGIEAICGRSLKKENKDLWKAVDRLFQIRNKIAHAGGEGLAIGDLKGHSETALQAFEWIDSLISHS